MKNELYQQMYEEYKKGYSLSEVGKMFNKTRQSVYSGFKCRGFKLRSKPQLPYQFFNGKKFTLRNNGYYGLSNGKRTMMHKYVWEYYNGNIPKGYDIHHKNNDKTDNRIQNLECLPKNEHTSKYSPHHNQYKNYKTLHKYGETN